MSDTNQAKQPQKTDRGLKFRFWKEDRLLHLFSENRDSGQFCGNDYGTANPANKITFLKRFHNVSFWF